MRETAVFLWGATGMACFAIGVYFLRFWQRSGDRFFVLFAIAFWVFAGNRVALLFVPSEQESARLGIYVIRLLAFLLIIAAVVDKNARRSRPAGS